MPTYVYRCQACGITFERMQRLSEPPLTQCPECHGPVRRVLQPVGIIFKGPGFYSTDYRSSRSGEGSRNEREGQRDKGDEEE